MLKNENLSNYKFTKFTLWKEDTNMKYVICTRYIPWGDEEIRLTMDLWNTKQTKKLFDAGTILTWEKFLKLDCLHNQYVSDTVLYHQDVIEF